MPTIIKVVDTYPKSSRICKEKRTVYQYFELNRDALIECDRLNAENTNENIRYTIEEPLK